MFIAYFKDGSSFTEKQGLWDEMPPEKEITSLHLTLPVQLKRVYPDGKEELVSPPTVHLSGYDDYYFANEAVSVIFRTLSGVMFSDPGKGTVIKQVIAGIDREHNLVIYIEVDKKANVTVKRFPLDKFNVTEKSFRKGYVVKKDDSTVVLKKETNIKPKEIN